MGSLGGAVVAGLAAFRAAFVAVLRRRGGRCPCCAGRRRGFVQFSDKVVACPLFRQQMRGGVAGAVPSVVDVPVIMQRR